MIERNRLYERLDTQKIEIERLRAFVQFVLDHSNDPAVIAEAKRVASAEHG